MFAYTGPKATVWPAQRAAPRTRTARRRKHSRESGGRGQHGGLFERTPGHLAYRLLAALEGGQFAGGDKRGQESAALVIVKKTRRRLHNDTVLRLQGDDNPEPIKELRRLVEKPRPKNRFRRRQRSRAGVRPQLRLDGRFCAKATKSRSQSGADDPFHASPVSRSSHAEFDVRRARVRSHRRALMAALLAQSAPALGNSAVEVLSRWSELASAAA
jgi:hypothetical protein